MKPVFKKKGDVWSCHAKGITCESRSPYEAYAGCVLMHLSVNGVRINRNSYSMLIYAAYKSSHSPRPKSWLDDAVGMKLSEFYVRLALISKPRSIDDPIGFTAYERMTEGVA